MKDITNYRPISLLSYMYRLFTRILQNRIKKVLDEPPPPPQKKRGGFQEKKVYS